MGYAYLFNRTNNYGLNNEHLIRTKNMWAWPTLRKYRSVIEKDNANRFSITVGIHIDAMDEVTFQNQLISHVQSSVAKQRIQLTELK